MSLRAVISCLVTAFLLWGCSESRSPRHGTVVFSGDGFTVYADSIVDGGAVFYADTSILRSVLKTYPSYSSDQPLFDRLYEVSARTLASGGRQFLSPYSVDLSMALLSPETSIQSLKAMVDDGHVGGMAVSRPGWPVSSDRLMWVVSAWELYKATGNRQWLSVAYTFAVRTLRDDMAVLWDSEAELMRGMAGIGSHPLAVYPQWMGPSDLYESKGLLSNVILVAALNAVAAMEAELNVSGPSYGEIATIVTSSINERLWIPSRGFYSAYLYGSPFPMQVMAADNMGQAMAIVSGVADGARISSIMAQTPSFPLGMPAFYPLENEADYISREAYMPPVQAYWNLAAMQAGEMDVLTRGLAEIIREISEAGILDREPLRYELAHAGMAAMVLKVLVGIRLKRDGLYFAPCIPETMTGERHLRGLRYRESIVDVCIKGTGTRIASFKLDGVQCDDRRIPATAAGHHSVEIVMANNRKPSPEVALPQVAVRPAEPPVEWVAPCVARFGDDGRRLRVYINDALRETTDRSSFSIAQPHRMTQISVMAVGEDGWLSFMSRPHIVIPVGAVDTLSVSGDTIWAGEGERCYVDVSYEAGADIPQYQMCSLLVNGRPAGEMVFGDSAYAGFSNMTRINLQHGFNTIALDSVGYYGDVPQGLKFNYIRMIRE